jgi:hypothetical protein
LCRLHRVTTLTSQLATGAAFAFVAQVTGLISVMICTLNTEIGIPIFGPMPPKQELATQKPRKSLILRLTPLPSLWNNSCSANCKI